MALSKAAITWRLFHQEKAALHGDGLGTCFVEPLEKTKGMAKSHAFFTDLKSDFSLQL